MKIAFCIENFITTRGGAEQYVHDLSLLLTKQGHEVHIYTMKSRRQSQEKLHIHMVDIFSGPRFIRTISFALSCRRKVTGLNFDIIHSFGRTWGMDIFQPLGGSQMAGLIGNLRSISNPLRRYLKVLTYIISLRRMVYFLVEKIQMKETKIVIAISAMVKRDLVHYCHLNEEKVRIVRNGVDLEKFHPGNRARFRASIRRELGLAEDDIFILFVAHNFRLKGLQTLIRALKYIGKVEPDHKFKVGVLGAGKKKKFSGYARKMGVSDKVTFISSSNSPPRYYAAADLSVHPSFYDPSALVVLEAMASGIPVITTTCCGTSEIIKEGREGFVVKTPSDISELAGRIVELNDPDLRIKMGVAGRIRAEEFPYSRNMEEILEIYNEYTGDYPR
ncbi:MAG: glycosyltransferase family 4 protein [Candidatus Auribacterota bacterium]|nr:glycosyltransferase family 4 protein [Candidatus Auribacterota bacterium]